MKRIFRIFLTLMLISFVFIGCAEKKDTDYETKLLSMDFSEIEKEARGTEVRFYMWGGSVVVNEWIDSVFADELKTKYDITLVRVPMDASVFVNKLISEKMLTEKKGLWIFSG